MKLVAGMGSIDDYIPYVKAGADEIFCGFIPMQWQSAWGLSSPLNRREVCFCNVQLGSFSELDILREMRSQMHVPVTLTFNSLNYHPMQYSMIADILCQCMDHGFKSFILADPSLLVYLDRQGLTSQMDIHISGEFSEISHYMIDMVRELGADRIIFHRRISPANMKKCILRSEDRFSLEWEAFFLNEMCLFHGGYCNSLHCDELPPLCHEPFRLASITDTSADSSAVEKSENRLTSIADPFKDSSAEKTESFPDRKNTASVQNTEDPSCLSDSYLTGRTGCGLCALWQLREAGITHLKIVGRGARSDDILQDIKNSRMALSILEYSSSEEKYINAMKQCLFPAGCSHLCYYPDLPC